MLFGLFEKRPKPRFSVAQVVKYRNTAHLGVEYFVITNRRFTYLKGDTKKSWVYDGHFYAVVHGELKLVTSGHVHEGGLREL